LHGLFNFGKQAKFIQNSLLYLSCTSIHIFSGFFRNPPNGYKIKKPDDSSGFLIFSSFDYQRNARKTKDAIAPKANPFAAPQPYPALKPP
jgi:hypothetical protein